MSRTSYFCKMSTLKSIIIKLSALLLLVWMVLPFPALGQLSSLDSAYWYREQVGFYQTTELSTELHVPYLERAAKLFEANEKYTHVGECYYTLALYYNRVRRKYIQANKLLTQAIEFNALAASPSNELEFECVLEQIHLNNAQRKPTDQLRVKFQELASKIKKLTPETNYKPPLDFNVWNRLIDHRRMFPMKMELLASIKVADLKKAEVIFKELSKKDKEILFIENAVAAYYRGIGDYNKSLAASHLSLTIEKDLGGKHYSSLARLLTFLGESYLHIGIKDQAIVCYEQALENLKQNNYPDSIKISKLYNYVGELYRSIGAYKKAIDYYTIALRITISTRGEISFGTGSVYNNLGETYYDLGEYKQALIWHQKSLKVREAIEYHPYLTNSYDNIGIAYLRLGDLSNAEKYIKKAYELRSKFPQTPPYEAYYMKSFSHMAELKKTHGQLNAALDFYHKAIKANKSKTKERGLSSYDFWNEVGEIQILLSREQKAIEAFTQAIKINAPNFDKKKVGFKGYYNALSLLASLEGKAKAYFALAQKKGNEEFMLRQALEVYHNCINLLIKIRQSYTDNRDKANIQKSTKSIYDNSMIVAKLLYDQTKDQQYLEQMFLISEYSKAGILLDANNRQYALNQGILPDSLIERESRLAALSSYYQQKMNEGNKRDLPKWRQLLFDVNEEQTQLNRKIDKYYPDYFKLKHNQHTISIHELQQKLKTNEGFLEFYEYRDELLAFLVSKNDFRLISVVKPTNFDIQQYRKSIINQDLRQFATVSHRLFNQLIKPLGVLDIDELIVVPSGRLWHVNLDLLLTNAPEIGDYRQFDFLLNTTSIRYAYSGSHLLNHLVQTQKQHKLLAFAPNYESLNQDFDQLNKLGQFRDEVGPLLYNKIEVEEINKQLEGEVFIGKEAVEKVFKTQVKKGSSIIHLAMHALVDNDKPSNSRLVFTHENDSLEDNFLHIYELYNMTLPADLAVLSACNTGLGKLESGEGFLSLGRAFAYAGCPAVVMSHWKVDDLVTSKLMDLFYKNLSKGMHKSKALQQAKLEYLNQAPANMASPFYWGSFVVLGNDHPIVVEENRQWPYYIGAALILFLALGLLRKRF